MAYAFEAHAGEILSALQIDAIWKQVAAILMVGDRRKYPRDLVNASKGIVAQECQ
jgi:hypothetical protein